MRLVSILNQYHAKLAWYNVRILIGRFIKITKINSSGTCFTYNVHEKDEPDFYMHICPQENKVYFYAENDFSNPNGIVDFNKEDNLLTFPGIPTEAPVPLAMVKAYKAIQANEFPDHLDYCA